MSSGLVTPNFSADVLGKHTSYIQDLFQKHAALSELVLDPPASDPNEDRILALRGRIQDAWSRADGNPASGRWALLSRLLRMGVTSGRNAKWVGARADIKSPECPNSASGWPNTMSESDWKEWEQKFIEDRRLKSKVETWKRGVEVVNHQENRPTTSQIDTASRPATEDLRKSGGSRLQGESGVALDKQSTKSAPVTAVDPLRDSAPFGFGVVKRSSQTSVLKPHAVGSPKLPADPSKGADSRSVGRRIDTTNAPETSAMRFSFSSAQLVTSTPKQIAKSTTNPLVARSQVSPLIPSTPSQKAPLGRASLQKYSSSRRHVSLPVIPPPEVPLQHTTSQSADPDTHDSINANNKRILVSSHPYPLAEADGRKSKKAKTITNADEVLRPQTPPRDRAVPTLTELLTSAKKTKKKRPEKPHISEKDLPVCSFSSPLNARATRDGKDTFPIGIATPLFFDPSPVDDFYSRLNDFDPSSGRSLSSIAGASDDEEEEAGGLAIAGGEIDEFVLNSSFRPLATSTQVQGDHHHRRSPKSTLDNPIITSPDHPSRPSGKGGNVTDSWDSIYAPPHSDNALPGPSALSSAKNKTHDSLFPQLSYNSQFESAVAAQVEKVSKVLQRDVEYDGLSSEAPAKGQEEEEEEPLSGSIGRSRSGQEWQNGYSYGYGKAFEYDESF